MVSGARKMSIYKIIFISTLNRQSSVHSKTRLLIVKYKPKLWEDFDHKFSQTMHRGYVLAHPDSRIAKKIPGTSDEFVLSDYKDWLYRRELNGF